MYILYVLTVGLEVSHTYQSGIVQEKSQAVGCLFNLIFELVKGHITGMFYVLDERHQLLCGAWAPCHGFSNHLKPLTDARKEQKLVASLLQII